MKKNRPWLTWLGRKIYLFYLISLFIVTWGITRDLKIAGVVLGLGAMSIVGLLFWHTGRKNRKYKVAELAEIDEMTGEEFEDYLTYLFQHNGFIAERTQASNDYGADVVLTEKRTGQVIVVQAKRYGKPVGVTAVQEVIGAINYYEADEAWVVTNQSFTRQAIQLAEANDVVLAGRQELIDWMHHMQS